MSLALNLSFFTYFFPALGRGGAISCEDEKKMHKLQMNSEWENSTCLTTVIFRITFSLAEEDGSPSTVSEPWKWIYSIISDHSYPRSSQQKAMVINRAQ